MADPSQPISGFQQERVTWNTPTAPLRVITFKYGRSGGSKISNFSNRSKGKKTKKTKTVIRRLQMCAFLWRFHGTV